MNRARVRAYDKEFKLNAVRLFLTGDRTYEQVSSELGIPLGTLVTWVRSYNKDEAEAFPGKGYLKPSDDEVARLRKELAVVREERDILKKALGIFSSQLK